jgi:hypothetical protein
MPMIGVSAYGMFPSRCGPLGHVHGAGVEDDHRKRLAEVVEEDWRL